MGATTTRLGAQDTDVIRGRVTGADSLPIPDARVAVTSISGNVTRSARTGQDGRYTVTFPGGDGDYIVNINAIGYTPRRFQLKRVADEHGTSLTLHHSSGPKALADYQAAHGTTPTEYLERLGVLGPRTVLAHALGIAASEIEAIARTDGVDGVFFGPSDLAASMGHLGNPGHPDVQKAVSEGIATVRRAGKPAGVLATDPKLARAYLEQGALFVAVGVDTTLLVRAATELAVSFKGAAAAKPAAGGGGY